jgi:hypothetical protein
MPFPDRGAHVDVGIGVVERNGAVFPPAFEAFADFANASLNFCGSKRPLRLSVGRG